MSEWQPIETAPVGEWITVKIHPAVRMFGIPRELDAITSGNGWWNPKSRGLIYAISASDLDSWRPCKSPAPPLDLTGERG